MEPSLAPAPVAPLAGTGAATRRHFPATAASVTEVRAFVRSRLPDDSGRRADEIVLMASELATNAVRHAGTAFSVSVAAADGGPVRVEVHDGASGHPVPRSLADDAPDGRGLHIVDALADGWGIEARRDRPGKTVWFEAQLRGVATAQRGPGRAGDAVAIDEPSWPGRGIRGVLDSLGDAIVATDELGTVRYANGAAEDLLGWPPGSLTGRSVLDLVPASLAGPFADGFESFLRHRAGELLGRRLPAVITGADGTEVDTDLVLSMFDHPLAGRVVVGTFRPRDDRRLRRWSQLTNELLEILADAPIDDALAERLLSTLGRRLGWDVATLWAVVPDGQLVCRHVWTRTPGIAPAFAREKGADPTSGADGLPGWVRRRNEPLWVADLRREPALASDALRYDGLQSAYAFPIRYRGACVGIVKLLSRDRRERDPSVMELTDAISGHLGELLHASAQVAEREHLVEELLEARRRNEFLLLATQVLSEVVDSRDMVERLAQVSVPVMADLCLIDIVDEDGQVRRMAARHADPAKQPLAEELRASYPPGPGGGHPIVTVLGSGRSMWSADMDDDFLRRTSHDDRHYAILKLLGFTSYMTVPLRVSNERVLGTVTLISAGSGRRFSEKDLGLAEQLAQQVSSVVIRARAYERERRISHELQRNLLPDAIPSISGWDVAARYLPAATGVEVGGDWYDVVEIDEHVVALVVGDVEGHDLEAAKMMSRIRHTLGLLLLEERHPGAALERLNRFCLAQVGTRLATALIGVLDTSSGDVHFSSAGHPSPLRVTDGRAMELAVPPGPPLGVERCDYTDHRHRIDTGCLVMFTDGLVERRGTALAQRLSRLETSLRSAPSTEPGPVADFAIEAMTADAHSTDDVVVLTACRAPGLPDPAG